MSRPPARARVSDTIRIGTELALPTIAGGVIKRRPAVLAAAEKLNLDRPAIRLMQRLRGRHGGGLLQLRVPGHRPLHQLSPDIVKKTAAECDRLASVMDYPPDARTNRRAGRSQPRPSRARNDETG